MKEFFKSIDAKLASWNIYFPNWSKFIFRVTMYFDSYKNHPSPWYGKVVKFICDATDMITYNAYAFMGMMLCALLLF